MDSVVFTREHVGEITICRISGKIDAHTASEVEKKLQDALKSGATKIVIDLQGLEYLSSAGMRVLLQVHKKIEASKGELILTSLNDRVMEIFSIAGLDHFFTLAETEEEAIKKLNNG